jgi:hypothetical protein
MIGSDLPKLLNLDQSFEELNRPLCNYHVAA